MTTTESTFLSPGETSTDQPPSDGFSAGPVASGIAAVRGAANIHGACSIERACGCSFGALSYTHEDARGWQEYLEKWHTRNFWFADCGVKSWIYYEPYDNWQDVYGVDAALAFYHSGHGGMDGNGVFYLPMSAPWGDEGCTVVSSNDKLQWGNERVRYIFLSTCLSLRVTGGHSPIRTWHKSNRGWRMLFGYETVSWDNPNYGKFFWQEWNKNKSLSTAFLDASWRIAHDQAPSVVACGANQSEAKDRLYNERYLSSGRVSNAWYWWRWYSARSSARAAQRTLPSSLLVAQLRPADAQETARSVAERFQMEMNVPAQVVAAADGSYCCSEGDKSIAYGSDGSIEVQLAKPNLDNLTPLAEEQAATLAQEALWRYGLDDEVAVVADRVSSLSEGGGTPNGSGQLEGPFTTGTVVQYRQVINGVPVITPDAGTVRIFLDNDGRVTGVHSSLRAIEQLRSRPARSVREPTPEGAFTARVLAPEPEGFDEQLDTEFRRQLAIAMAKGGGGMPPGYTTVPDSVEVGYDIRGNEAVLISRKAVEVSFGSGYRKRYWVAVPLFE